ncbi:MAG: iron-sulfur cluster assembly protein, partial [Pseudomonadota bacterium]|nr:iron-sulfur cluster assembly protein [Pseudomonadota bacterium]
MTEIKREQIQAVLSGIIDLNLGKDLVAAKVVQGIHIEGDQVRVALVLGYPAKGYKAQLANMIST